MSVASLYGSLAASASVFIGISAAFLVNKLVTTEQEYNRISREISRKEEEQKQISALVEKFDSRISEIESKWREEKIEKTHGTVDYFIEEHIRDDGFNRPPENTDIGEITNEFKRYMDISADEELSAEVVNVIQDRRNEIEKALAKSATKNYISNNTREKPGLMPELEPDFETIIEEYKNHYKISNLWPESQAGLKDAYLDKEGGLAKSELGYWPEMPNSIISEGTKPKTLSDRKDAEMNNYSRLRVKREEANSRYERFEEEINLLQDERSSIDSNPIRQSLLANIIGIVLSVVVPTMAYFLIEVGFPDPIGIPTWVEALVVMISWIAGLSYIIYKLYQQVDEVTTELN